MLLVLAYIAQSMYECNVEVWKCICAIYFLRIVVEVKSFGPPHVLELWLCIGKGMLPVEYFISNKSSFLC